MKRISNVRSLVFGVAFFAALLILLPAQAKARPIKVGIIDCYSGPAAVFGKDALNGF